MKDYIQSDSLSIISGFFFQANLMYIIKEHWIKRSSLHFCFVVKRNEQTSLDRNKQNKATDVILSRKKIPYLIFTQPSA